MTDTSDSIKPSIATLFIAAVVVLCLFFLTTLHRKVNGLTATTEQLIEESAWTRKALVVLGQRINEANGRLDSLLKNLEQTPVPENNQAESSELADPRLLESGLYQLETVIVLRHVSRPEQVKKTYTIYHLKAAVGEGADKADINLGIAVSGVSIPVFYVDYDEDGLVDLRLMQDFSRFLPLGGLVGQSIDGYNAQKVYRTFLTDFHAAKFTPLGEIMETGGKIAQGLYSFVIEQSEHLANWIAKELSSSTTESTTATRR